MLINLRKLRECKGYSQQYVAMWLDMSQYAYSKIESGRTSIKLDHLEKLQDLLGFKLTVSTSPDLPASTAEQLAELKLQIKVITKLLYSRPPLEGLEFEPAVR